MDQVETTENKQLEEVESSAGEGQRIRLLVVDDSPYVLQSIHRILESVPEIEVITAMDGVEAMEQVRRSAPDLVLVDLQMQHMDGLETTRLIKQYAPETKVVTMSNRDHEMMEDASKERGAEAYFVKNRLYRLLLPALGARFPQLSVWIH